MLLRNWGNDESRMEVDDGCSQRGKLGISSCHFDVLDHISGDPDYESACVLLSVFYTQ